MTASIKDGLRAAARHPKLTLLLWAWYGLLAMVAAVPAWNWWNAVLGASPEAASVLTRFDLGVFLDLTRSEGVSAFSLLTGSTAALAVVALISSSFVFGGILEVFGSEDDRRSFMHRFFRGGGHFFWRFVRLALVAGVCAVLAVGAVAGPIARALAPFSDSEWEPAGYLFGLGVAVTVALVAGFFLLALDYARISVARHDSRSMLRAYGSGLGFVVRRLIQTYGIAIAIVILEAALLAIYLAYETKAPAAGNWGAIGLLFAFQQVLVLGRVFFRVALVGAERQFHVASLPTPVPVVVTEATAVPAPLPPVSLEPEEGVSPT